MKVTSAEIQYIASGGLAGLAAIAELTRLFPGELFTVLGRARARVYLLVNVLLGVLAVAVLRFLAVPTSNAQILEQVVLAGLGARTVLRLHVGTRSRGEDRTAGSVVDSLLGALRQELRREVSVTRVETLRLTQDLDFDAAYPFFVSHIASALLQDYTESERASFTANLKRIQGVGRTNPRLALDELVYLALNYGGTEFFESLLSLYRERQTYDATRAAEASERLDATSGTRLANTASGTEHQATEGAPSDGDSSGRSSESVAPRSREDNPPSEKKPERPSRSSST